MKTFVISLNRADERGNPALRAILEKHGFSVEFLNATNGKLMPAGDYFANTRSYFRATGQMLTPSEVGCSVSHLRIYRKIIEENLHCALVLEDDAIIDNISCTTIHDLIALRLHEKGFVHLGGQDGMEDYISRAHGRVIEGPHQIWDVNPDDWDKVYRTVGYVISNELARRLVTLSENGVFVSDDFRYCLGGVGCEHLFLCNCLGHPADLTNSTIEAERKMAREQYKELHLGLFARLRQEISRTIKYRVDNAKRARRAQKYLAIELRRRPSDPELAQTVAPFK